MEAKEGLWTNIATVGMALLVPLLISTDGGGTSAFFVAFAIGLAGTLFSAWRAARGSALQVVATPITGIILSAVLVNFAHGAPLLAELEVVLLAVALGVPILAPLLPGRDPRFLMVVGAIVGLIGVGFAAAAITRDVPGFNLFVPFDRIPALDPFRIGFFQQLSDAELAERIRHNAGTEYSWGSTWRGALFLLQTVVVSAWDALILGVCVLVVGLVVSAAVRVVSR
jgi:hypothetical protein